MSRRPIVHRLAVAAFLVVPLVSFAAAIAVPTEPTPEPTWRALRPDAVKTWHIFNDRNLNGILDPGDERIDTFQNWWTPVSAHTQHNYEIGPYGANNFFYGVDDDKASGPMNFASQTNAADNYWLPMDKNAAHFYMSYSQFDNNDWSTFDGGGTTPTGKSVAQDRNLERNGYVLGWVTHNVTKDSSGNMFNDQTQAGHVEMDVYVHNGQLNTTIGGWGDSRSNPQIATSNDISKLALDNSDGPGTGKQWHPPQFDDATGTYSWAENAERMIANGYDAADLATIVGSMETAEKAPLSLAAADVIWANRTPQEILNNEVDHTGAAYVYEDAFIERSNYVEGATDGAVVAGLAGYDNYNLEVNNWGDQQVIRIDLSASTLSTGDPETQGNITSVVFYDFGEIGSTQINPRPIVLDLANTSLFPENRFYIAQVETIPEPSTVAVLLLGGVGLVLRRRRRAV